MNDTFSRRDTLKLMANMGIATFAGGAMLLIADTLARQLAAPAQLPVGVVTALIGVPVFLILLRRER